MLALSSPLPAAWYRSRSTRLQCPSPTCGGRLRLPTSISSRIAKRDTGSLNASSNRGDNANAGAGPSRPSGDTEEDPNATDAVKAGPGPSSAINDIRNSLQDSVHPSEKAVP